MTAKIKILFVDDQCDEFTLMPRVLARHGIQVIAEKSAAKTFDRLQEEPEIDLLLLDLHFPGHPIEGSQVFARLRQERPDLPIIIFTSHDQISKAREFQKAGAADYIFKHPEGIDFDELASQIERVYRLAAQQRLLERAAGAGSDVLVGASAAFLAAKEEALRVAASPDTNVLLTGESGVGKELFANLIHQHSSRSMSPIVKIDVTTLPGELLEGELFGSLKGAFTGAVDRKGLLETADGGTVLLDEIGELPLAMQPKLLRVLQEREVRRLGGKESRRLDVRFLFATNRDLSAMVAEGSFREDLFFRISTYPIRIPPLREHLEDLELLAAHFLKKRSWSGQEPFTLSGQAWEVLKGYHFPGNIRELENLLEAAMVRSSSPVLEAADFRLHSGALPQPPRAGSSSALNLEALAAQVLLKQRKFEAAELEIADYYKERQTTDFLELLRSLIRLWKREKNASPMLKDLAAAISPEHPSREAQRISQILSRAAVSYAQLQEEAEN